MEQDAWRGRQPEKAVEQPNAAADAVDGRDIDGVRGYLESLPSASAKPKSKEFCKRMFQMPKSKRRGESSRYQMDQRRASW